MKKNLYTLAISSFAVHGTASLKTFISILGDKILPVPTLLLNGLTNMSLVNKIEYPFEELLRSTFELAEYRQLKLIVYIGYLGHENQAEIILNYLEKYKSMIKTIIVDPVSGDNGKLYVSENIIEKWPSIIQIADFVFPNFTEIHCLTQNIDSHPVSSVNIIDKFKVLFPKPTLVLKSMEMDPNRIGVLVSGIDNFNYSLNKIPKMFGGTGDLFLSLFILFHFYKKDNFRLAIMKAVDKTHFVIKESFENNSDDLLINSLAL